MTETEHDRDECPCCTARMKGSDHCPECYCEQYQRYDEAHLRDYARKLRKKLEQVRELTEPDDYY